MQKWFFQFFQPVTRVIELARAALPLGARIHGRLRDVPEIHPWHMEAAIPGSVRNHPKSATEANLVR